MRFVGTAFKTRPYRERCSESLASYGEMNVSLSEKKRGDIGADQHQRRRNGAIRFCYSWWSCDRWNRKSLVLWRYRHQRWKDRGDRKNPAGSRKSRNRRQRTGYFARVY